MFWSDTISGTDRKQGIMLYTLGLSTGRSVGLERAGFAGREPAGSVSQFAGWVPEHGQPVVDLLARQQFVG